MNFTTDRILHGGDYNPEQWLDYPEILAEVDRKVREHYNLDPEGAYKAPETPAGEEGAEEE